MPNVDFSQSDDIAQIRIDDGKANVANPELFAELNEALDSAEQNAKALILCGREGTFSAGFDLKALQGTAERSHETASGGFALLLRLFGFPLPLVAASDGHAIGLGAFMLLCSDVRIASDRDCKIGLPETALSMWFNALLMAVLDARLSPQHFTEAALLSHMYAPKHALAPGFLDQVVAPEELDSVALARAQELAQLPAKAFARNKKDLRHHALETMRADLDKFRS